MTKTYIQEITFDSYELDFMTHLLQHFNRVFHPRPDLSYIDGKVNGFNKSESDYEYGLSDWGQEDKAQRLMERGDMGYCPSGKYPSVWGNSEREEVWKAAMGATQKEYESSLRYKLERDHPEFYPLPRQAAWKRLMKRGDRAPSSKLISKEQFVDLHSAICFANTWGVPMDAHVVIHWGLMGYTDHEKAAQALQDDFLKHLTGWWHYNFDKHNRFKMRLTNQLFWLYVHECGASGFHTHLLLGIPREASKAFRKWVKNRVNKLSIGTPNPKAVKVMHSPSRPIERQWNYFQYLCKGVDPKATVSMPEYPNPVPLSYLIQFENEDPGEITCKNRVGMSKTLSKSERQTTGYVAPAELGIFHKNVLYTDRWYADWLQANPDPEVLRETLRSLNI